MNITVRGGAVSKDIFKKLHTESKVQEGVTPVGTTEKINFDASKLNMPDMNGGGAAASMMKKRIAQSATYKKREENPTVTTEEPIKEAVQAKKTINVEDYITNLLDSIVSVSATNDYGVIVRDLISLYLIGELGNYELTGIDGDTKSEVLAIIDDFKATVEKSFV